MIVTDTYNTRVNKISLFREPSSIIKTKISSSQSINRFARQLYNESLTIYESFYIVLLDNSNTTTGYVEISKGSITGTLVDVRIVAKHALESLSVGVILVHNHPSGTLTPSQADKDLTKKLKVGLSLLDIKVLDHIILTEFDYFSFADDGIL